jgi:ankyrin repeat protein
MDDSSPHDTVFKAISGNDATGLARMLDDGIDVDAYIWSPCGKYEASLLSLAASHGAVDVARLLIERGAPVAAADGLGQTALHIAAGDGFVEIVSLLVGVGADIEARTDGGVTPLVRAAHNDRVDVVALLAELGADPSARVASSRNATAMHWAASNARLDVIRVLKTACADINATDSSDETPLHWAAMEQRPDAVALLVALGCDLEVEESSGCTPLFVAVTKKDLAICRLLVDAGANIRHLPDAHCDGALSPFQQAIEDGWLDGVRYMAEAVDIDPLEDPYEGYASGSLSCRGNDDMQALLRSLATAREVRLSLAGASDEIAQPGAARALRLSPI